MVISITAFGSLFLPLALVVGLFRPAALLPLLAIAAVLQGPAVATVGNGEQMFGVSPFLVAAALTSLAYVLRRRSEERLGTMLTSAVARGWIVFLTFMLLSLLPLAWLNLGVGVLPPMDRAGPEAQLQPLGWTLSHLAQVINVVLIGFWMAWLSRHANQAGLTRWLLFSVVLAVALAALIGLQQRLAWNGLMPAWTEIWASNPSYVQSHFTMTGRVPRVNWPFVDASYASAFFSAAFGGFCAMYLAGLHRHKALAGLMVSLFALANTLGATGMLTVGLYLLLIAGLLPWLILLRRDWAGGLLYRIGLAALAASCVVLGSFLVLRHYELLPIIAPAFEGLLAGESRTLLADLRPHAYQQSLVLLRESWGFGVGMGSHRGSSYLLTLAANGGLIGLTLFLVALAVQFSCLARRAMRCPDAPTMFFLGGGVAMVIAVSIAIPDQNWPAFWLFILGGTACVLAPATVRSDCPEPLPKRR